MLEYIEFLLEYLQIPMIKALLFIIGSIIAAKLADWIISGNLAKLVSNTTTSIDDKVVQILHRPIYYTILFTGLGISIRLLEIPDIIRFSLIGLFKTITIVIWSIALFQSFMLIINWYSIRGKNENIIQRHTLPLFDNIGKVIIFVLAVYFIIISW